MKKKGAAAEGAGELQRKPRPLMRAVLIAAAYLLAFILLDAIAKQFEELRGVVAWYPPAGLTYTLLLVFGVRFAPAVTVALFLSSVFIYRMPQAPYLLLLWAVILSLIYSLAAAFLRKIIRFDWQLRKFQDVTWLIATAIVVSALLAVLSVSSSTLSSAMPRSEVLRAIFHWWIGETVGILTVTPFLLTHVIPDLIRFTDRQPVRSPARRSFPPPTLSGIGQAACLALTLYWVFGVRILDEFHPMYLISLPLIWIALQGGFKGVSAGILALNTGVVFALWLFRSDPGRLGELELLMIVNCILGLLMGAVVTERKQAEQALRENEERFRSMLDNIEDGYYEVDTAGNLTFFNPAQVRILGRPADELMGMNNRLYMTPDTAKAVFQSFNRVFRTGIPEQAIDWELLRPDGSRRSVEASVSLIRAVNGSIHGFQGIVRDITGRIQREAELRSRTDELSALYRLSGALADASDLEDLIGLVNRHAVESVHTTFACIALLESGALVTGPVYPVRVLEHAFSRRDRQPLTALPACQRVLDLNEAVILQAGSAEVGTAERTTLWLDLAQTVCLVPLRVGDASKSSSQALGLLILGEMREEKREPFTPAKMRLARGISDQAAAAIHRLQLREQAGLRLQRLASLGEIDRTSASNFDLPVSLQMILKQVSEQLGADAVDVLLFNVRLQTLEFTTGRGFLSGVIESTRLRLGEGLAGRAALENRIIQIPDVAASGEVFAWMELIRAERVVSYFAVPLTNKGQIKGVLEIYQRTPLVPDEEWLGFLKTLARQAAIAIDTAQLFDHLQSSNNELRLAYDATIEGWSHALDLRDKETEGHTQRVVETTVNLARNLGLGEEQLVQVRRGALLHDIGKMGVPDHILLKPGVLTDEEWLVMKKHPTYAYEMLSPIGYLHTALDIPYCHHEWWNGTGYPRGLKGEQIPLTARIFAVVDVWDALISDRPYRKKWSEEKARQNIQAEAGTHFDPQVVKTFFLEHG